MNNLKKLRLFQKENGLPKSLLLCDYLNYQVTKLENGVSSNVVSGNKLNEFRAIFAQGVSIDNVIYHPNNQLTERQFISLGFRLFVVSVKVEEVRYITTERILVPSQVARDQIEKDNMFLHTSKFL